MAMAISAVLIFLVLQYAVPVTFALNAEDIMATGKVNLNPLRATPVAATSLSPKGATSTEPAEIFDHPLFDTSALAIWYDACDTTTLLDVNGQVVNASGAIHTWMDKSGHGVHATNQYGDKPVLVSDGMNGNPAVRFTATGKLTGTQLRGAQSLGAGPVSFFVVYRWRALHNVYPIDTLFTLGTEFDGGSRSGETSVSGCITSGSTNEAVSLHGVTLDGPDVVLDETTVLCMTYDNTTLEVTAYRNNNVLGQRTGVAGPLPAQIILGSWDASWLTGSEYPEYFADADLSEVIVFSKTLNEMERNTVYAYLSDKYNGSSTQPTENAQPTAEPTSQPADCGNQDPQPPRGIQRVDGYVVHRDRKEGQCRGAVRNVRGTAVGCLDYVLTTCAEEGDSVIVTKRYLNPQDPRSLACEPDAPQLNVSSTVYPRCDASTGVATSCTGLDAEEAPYPRKHAGMVSLSFRDETLCQAHLTTPEQLLPAAFEQARNAACLWDHRFEVWYREACDAATDTLTLTLYADSACRKKAKRAAVHRLSAEVPDVGQCVPRFGADHQLLGYRTQYCHSTV